MLNGAQRHPPFCLRLIANLVRATIELAFARLRHLTQPLKALLQNNMDGPSELNSAQVELVEQVAFVIPRVAKRLPLRADCLIQALAAQHWLARYGIRSVLVLGVPCNKAKHFEAHAWLTVGERVVTGGDISNYVPLTHA